MDEDRLDKKVRLANAEKSRSDLAALDSAMVPHRFPARLSLVTPWFEAYMVENADALYANLGAKIETRFRAEVARLPLRDASRADTTQEIRDQIEVACVKTMLAEAEFIATLAYAAHKAQKAAIGWPAVSTRVAQVRATLGSLADVTDDPGVKAMPRRWDQFVREHLEPLPEPVQSGLLATVEAFLGSPEWRAIVKAPRPDLAEIPSRAELGKRGTSSVARARARKARVGVRAAMPPQLVPVIQTFSAALHSVDGLRVHARIIAALVAAIVPVKCGAGVEAVRKLLA